MQHINQLIYAIFFAFTLKLSFGSFLDSKYRKTYISSRIYWTITSGFISLSCLFWAIAPIFSFELLTLASTCLVGSMLSLALLLRSLNQSISRNLLLFVIGFTLIFAIQFEFFRLADNYVMRSTIATITIAIIAVWQLIELIRQINQKSSLHLKMGLVFILVMIGIVLLRIYAHQYQDTQLAHNIYNESFLMLALRACFMASHVLVLISLNNHYYENLWLLAHKKASLKEDQMISSLKSLSLARDNETGNHIIRTQYYVKALATRLKSLGYYTEELTNEAIENLYKAAPLHDIGKVGIPDEILLKSGQLTPSERETMKTHTSIGETVLSAAEAVLNQQDADDDDVITKAMRIAGGHHEKWDGTGYPRGLKGDEIPLEARIMSLADIYDALVSERVYKKEWSYEQTVKEILSKRGTQFDPVIVDAFLLEAENFNQIAQKLKD